MSNISINDIETMTEEQARGAALETMNIKGHNIYFVDFGATFGYSALVFLNGGYLYYANDYEHHHPGKWTEETGWIPYTRAELREIFITGMNYKLFTESELVGPVSDYDEAERKGHYIRNYYPMQKKYVSIFGNFSGPQGEKNRRELQEKTKNMIFSPVCFSYFDDAEFVRHVSELMDGLNKAREALKDSYNYWLGAFKSEMYNHEYSYARDDYEVLSAFGPLNYEEGDYFGQLGFTEIQRTAYKDARREVLASY